MLDTLDDLMKEGYKLVDLDFPIYDTLVFVFQKDKEVILYNPELEKVIMKYKK